MTDATINRKKSPRDTVKPRKLSPIALPDYRANPRRAVFLNGSIGSALLDKLTPQIVKILAGNRDPVTVYIDSPGGSTYHASLIKSLLRASDADAARPCRIITVVTSYAGSAAADLLASGDYAIAHSGSLIHFHGARTRKENLITVEEASGVARELKASNNRSAIELASLCKTRFFFRMFSQRSGFAEFRGRAGKPNLDGESCFLGIISEKLSPLGLKVIARAQSRKQRYQSVSDHVFRSKGFKRALEALTRSGEDFRLQRRLEAEMLRAIVTFEFSQNEHDSRWTFQDTGLAQLTDDFLLMNEYISHHRGINELCTTWEDFLLTDSERSESSALSGAEKQAWQIENLSPRVLPFWLFFAALCHALQAEENPMTATDAFWLGLIDEVIGEDLPTLRKVLERSPGRKPPFARKGAMSATAKRR